MPNKALADVATWNLADLKRQRLWFQISQEEYERRAILLYQQGARDDGDADLGKRVLVDHSYPQEIIDAIIAGLTKKYETGQLTEEEFVEVVTPWVRGDHTWHG